MVKQNVGSTQLTYDDYVLFPEDGQRHEIIDGDHYMTPAPRTKHQKVSINLSASMHSFVKEHSLGLVFAAPCDVILSSKNVVQPDLIFVSTACTSIVTEDNIQGAPDIVIEIISERTRKKDEIIKRKLYERFGIREYWLLDPELETVKIYRRAEHGYGRALELSKENRDVLTTDLLPDFRLSLAAIFE
jgi:Uma2 family endonuclease